jgi:hypothetical protein
MGGEEERDEKPATPPPGEGESLEDASNDALREIERRDGEGHAGTGDIG